MARRSLSNTELKIEDKIKAIYKCLNRDDLLIDFFGEIPNMNSDSFCVVCVGDFRNELPYLRNIKFYQNYGATSLKEFFGLSINQLEKTPGIGKGTVNIVFIGFCLLLLNEDEINKKYNLFVKNMEN